MREHQDRAKFYLEETLKEAEFYLNGDKLELKSKDFKFNIQESLEKLIEIVYHKLDYIDTLVDYMDIKKLFKDRKSRDIQLDVLENPNENVLSGFEEYIN